MESTKRNNLSKKDISKQINLISGLPTSYSSKILDDVINIIINLLKNDSLIKIKNFAVFKIVKKKSRLGRNPKNKQIFNISERNVVSVKFSKFLKKKINNEL